MRPCFLGLFLALGRNPGWLNHRAPSCLQPFLFFETGLTYYFVIQAFQLHTVLGFTVTTPYTHVWMVT